VRHLYDHANWWPHRSVEDIANVLREGTAAGAWYDGQLVGFARAVSDGRFHAYIDDVVVHPDYRRRGVAGMIMDELLNALADIETVSLFCAPEPAGTQSPRIRLDGGKRGQSSRLRSAYSRGRVWWATKGEDRPSPDSLLRSE
jgi:GNAT superfamily N-acetyltransferase